MPSHLATFLTPPPTRITGLKVAPSAPISLRVADRYLPQKTDTLRLINQKSRTSHSDTLIPAAISPKGDCYSHISQRLPTATCHRNGHSVANQSPKSKKPFRQTTRSQSPHTQTTFPPHLYPSYRRTREKSSPNVTELPLGT